MEVVLAFMLHDLWHVHNFLLQVRTCREGLQWKHKNHKIHEYLNITSEAKAKLLGHWHMHLHHLLHLLMRNTLLLDHLGHMDHLFLHQRLKHNQHKQTEIDSSIRLTNINWLSTMSWVIGTGTSTVCSTCCCWTRVWVITLGTWTTSSCVIGIGTSTVCSTCCCCTRVCVITFGTWTTSSWVIGIGTSTVCSTCCCWTRVWVITLGTWTTSSCCIGDWNLHGLFHMLLLHPSLCHDLWHMNHLFLSHGHRDLHCLLHVLMLDSSLRNDLWHLNFLLLHHWHWYLNGLLNLLMLNPSLGDNLGNMNNLFLHHRHRYLNNLLNLFVLHTLLSDDLGNMHDFLLDLWDWHFNQLLHMLMLDPLLNHHLKWMNRWHLKKRNKLFLASFSNSRSVYPHVWDSTLPSTPRMVVPNKLL